CYTLPASTIPLGSDLDGTTPPPRGEPNLLINLGPTDDRLQYWRFHADWTDQARTTLTGPQELKVAPYTRACESTDPTRCVPQVGTAQKLDSLSYSPMYRFAYRNFGDHQSLVVNHAVDARGGVGVRWYELRLRHGRPVVHQQSTYAPDPTYRWMGSAAMDKNGDIALGYSQSSSRTHPSIRVTGRLARRTAHHRPPRTRLIQPAWPLMSVWMSTHTPEAPSDDRKGPLSWVALGRTRTCNLLIPTFKQGADTSLGTRLTWCSARADGGWRVRSLLSRLLSPVARGDQR
ncbi:hypothetical protein AB4Z54_28595, partial [Streptomyces sp. MCAF7]